MSLIWIVNILSVFFLCVFFAGIVIPQILLIAFRRRLFDEPDERKIHQCVVPRLGGMAFKPVVFFSFVLLLAVNVSTGHDELLKEIGAEALPLAYAFCAIIMLYLVGIADDLIGVRYRAKFFIQIVCGIMLVAGGVELSDLHGMLFIHSMPSWISIPLTVFVTVFIINAINLIDGIDGLASGLCSIAFLFYGMTFIWFHQYLYAMLAFATLGVLIPFYYYPYFRKAGKGAFGYFRYWKRCPEITVQNPFLSRIHHQGAWLGTWPVACEADCGGIPQRKDFCEGIGAWERNHVQDGAEMIIINTKQEENMNKQFIITNFAAFALMLFLPTGCRQADGKQDAVQSYRVIKVAASPVEISESYSAAIRGRQDVDILPQISGRIIRLKVKEGERVKTGQVLAVIDQVPYRAALRTAQANVSAAQAKVETARIELRGKQALFDEKVISDYELSLARNQLAVACAELEQAKAQESDARNNLSYTEIKSPSNGVVGTLPYRIGALVGPNMAQPFTVVSDNAEMYAYFSISENMLRRYLARYGSIDSMIAGMPEVGLQLNDGSLYKAKGRIETVSGVVDPVTGTVQIKALFPNPDRELLSGSIGNVILQNPKTEAVTIPMTATVELQDKIIAYRLKNGQAEAAYLTVDRLNDGNRFIVKEGLSVGDTIVAEGVGLVREGMSITPKNETK